MDNRFMQKAKQIIYVCQINRFIQIKICNNIQEEREHTTTMICPSSTLYRKANHFCFNQINRAISQHPTCNCVLVYDATSRNFHFNLNKEK
jgi:hypothetical protein